ncbi:hypothetical protein [Desertihabitans brevis]|nr:hypothetical protein [Desertihabitans brevis]
MTTVSSMLSEAVRLAARSGQLWWRLWPQLIGLMLLGWLAYQVSTWVTVTQGIARPYLVVPLFATGLVGMLAATVIGLRMVATQLGVRELVRGAEPDAEDDDERDTSLTSLLVLTLLPFLAVYAAFGYVDDLATALVVRNAAVRGPFENILVGLNPLNSRTATVVTIGALVGLYVLRRVLDTLHDRTRVRLFGLLTAFVEACFLLLFLLSGFRLVEQANLWLSDRRLMSWWDAAMADLAAGFSVFRIDLPDVLLTVGTFVGEVVWPVFWNGLTEPIAWLAMAALVFGAKVVSVADLWRKGEPLAAQLPGARQTRLVRRLETAGSSSRLRTVALQVQEAFLGDIDDKYLPTWQSLRLVLRAGIVFLGGYVIVSSVLSLSFEVLDLAMYSVIGGQSGDVWARIDPFLDLVDRVLHQSLRVVLLAVAFTRALSLFAGQAAGAEQLPGAQPAGPRRVAGWRSQLGQAAVALLLCLGLAGATVGIQQVEDSRRLSAEVGERAELMGRQVSVGEPRYGQVLVDISYSEPTELDTTPLVFVALPVDLAIEGERPVGNLTVTLVNGDRSYPAMTNDLLPGESGVVSSIEMVYEVDPADLDGLHAELGVGAFITGFSDVVVVDLGLDRAAAERVVAEAAGRELSVSSQSTTRPIR